MAVNEEELSEGVEVEESESADVQPNEGQASETNADGGLPEAAMPPAEGDGEPSPTEEFEFEGVPFKGLTQQQREAIEKGALRVADYTKKTQQIAKAEKWYNNLHQSMLKDPKLFLKYFPPSYLEYVLGGAKRSAQPDQSRADDIDLSKFDEHSQGVVKSLLGKISNLEQTIKQYDNRFGEVENWVSSSETRKIESELESEVNAALKKYPSLNDEYNKSLIYTQIAKNGELSAMDIAARLDKMKKASWSNKVTTTQKNAQTKVVGAGRSSPPVPKAPKTYEEADKLINQRLGIGG